MTSYGYRTADGIEISIKPADDGGWCARAWFDGKNGAQYKEYAFGGTEQEAKDTVIENVHNHAQWRQPAPVASTQDRSTRSANQKRDDWQYAGICPCCGNVENCLCTSAEIEQALQTGREHLATLASEPADVATDAVAAVKLEPHEINALRCYAESPQRDSKMGCLDEIGFKFLEMGFLKRNHFTESYEITAAGREHLATLASEPADVATDEPTITISLNDAHEISIALIAQIKRLTEYIDDPDYEGNTDNLVRIIQKTEAVLDRLTAQLP